MYSSHIQVVFRKALYATGASSWRSLPHSPWVDQRGAPLEALEMEPPPASAPLEERQRRERLRQADKHSSKLISWTLQWSLESLCRVHIIWATRALPGTVSSGNLRSREHAFWSLPSMRYHRSSYTAHNTKASFDLQAHRGALKQRGGAGLLRPWIEATGVSAYTCLCIYK